MAIKAFKMYHPREHVEALETHGQCWISETIEDSIDLCRFQTIEPIFNKYLPKKGRILEAGCGLGRWVIYYRRKGYDIIGIDLAKAAIERTKMHDPSVPISIGNILKADYPDGYFDAVISLGVVEHFEDGPTEALKEAHRLLGKDGLLFISVPSQNAFRKLLINHLKRLKMFIQERRGHPYAFEEYRYTRAQMEYFLTNSGFDIIEVVVDEFSPPKNMGLYVDLPVLRHEKNNWELNRLGKMLHTVLTLISKKSVCSGYFWVCRKK
jgi:SAM-dependent methyltransferase